VTISCTSHCIQFGVDERTKHIKMDCHFIPKKIHSKKIEIPFVKSKDQMVDICTKGLEPISFEENLNILELIDIYNLNLRWSVE
jgi:hypothetical protein